MDKRNDNPTVDSIAYLESQGIPTDDEDEDDIHFCKKCKKIFKKLDEYLEHKVKHDKFKVLYNRGRGDKRMVLPTLTKIEVEAKPVGVETNIEGHPEGDVIPVERKRRRKRKAPPVDIQLIAERNTYICTTCDRKFSREASLKWHIEYEHKADADSDEESLDEGTSRVTVKDECEDTTFVIRKACAPKRPKVDAADGERPFKCDVCSSSFKDAAVLKTHMLTHTSARHYKCGQENCPYSFKTKGSLVRHMRRHTGERPYSCDMCGRKFAESGALARHQRSRNPCMAKTDADLPRYGKKWNYVPNIPAAMGDSSKSGDGFANVMPGEMVVVLTEGENGEHILTEAQVVSNNETVSTLNETEEMEEGEVTENEVGQLLSESDMQSLTPTQCRVCKEECLEVEGLRAHLRLHLADFPYHCGLCHYTTEQRNDLHTHMQSKHLCQLKGIDPNILLPPLDNSASKENKGRHFKDNMEACVAVKQLLDLPAENTNDETEQLSARAICRCPVCNRAFRGTSYLKQHMKSHTGDRPHQCTLCKKAFVTKDALNKHFIVHSEDRNFKCGECGKLFKRIGHVREHLKIHNSDRPFCCSICEKSFKTNNALKVHIRTHSDFYPFECRVCHRHFREKGSLMRHTRTHTGERPYRCHRCGRGFAEHGTLSRHRKAKIGCNPHLRNHRTMIDEGTQDSTEALEREEQQELEDAIPTVLAEFSSVVTDTQQYIVEDQLSDGENQLTEYVVLHTDLSSDDIQNVEIVTGGNIDPDTILNSVSSAAGNRGSFVVVNEPGNQLRIIDSSTGLTLATMPVSDEQDSSLSVTAADCVDNGLDGFQGTLTVSQEMSNVASGNCEAYLEPTLSETAVPEQVTMHLPSLDGFEVNHSEAGTITVHCTSAGHFGVDPDITQGIIVQTDAGPVTVVGTENVSDAVKQAIMELTAVGHKDTLQVVLTQHPSMGDCTVSERLEVTDT